MPRGTEAVSFRPVIGRPGENLTPWRRSAVLEDGVELVAHLFGVTFDDFIDELLELRLGERNLCTAPGREGSTVGESGGR